MSPNLHTPVRVSPSLYAVAFSLVALTTGCNGPAPPNPQDSTLTSVAASAIDEIDLRSGWLFYRYPPDVRADPAALPDSGWQAVSLPHTANLEPRIVNDQWQGDALYRLSLEVQPGWADKTIWLRFEGAMSVARVYLDGAFLVEHKGGYLPFTVDLTDRLREGAPNELLVHLDNRDNPSIGPKPLEQLDFSMYGGLYREVRLFVRDSLHITDEMLADRVAGGGVFVTFPMVSEDLARVDVRTHVANSGLQPRRFRIRHYLRDGETVVAEASSDALELSPGGDLEQSSSVFVDAPRLWSPQFPNLYELETIIESEAGVVDRRRTRVGIRRIEISADGFRINGERMFCVASTGTRSTHISATRCRRTPTTATPGSSRRRASTTCVFLIIRTHATSCAPPTNWGWWCSTRSWVGSISTPIPRFRIMSCRPAAT